MLEDDKPVLKVCFSPEFESESSLNRLIQYELLEKKVKGRNAACLRLLSVTLQVWDGNSPVFVFLWLQLKFLLSVFS